MERISHSGARIPVDSKALVTYGLRSIIGDLERVGIGWAEEAAGRLSYSGMGE